MQLFLLLLATQVWAHRELSKQELKDQVARQERAYRCMPEIAEYTKHRREANQVVFEGLPASTNPNELFLQPSSNKLIKNLQCTEVEDSGIRNHTCILSPETTQGPYFHNAGHPIRQNLAENQDGVLFLMDIGVIDVETCKPVPNMLVDLWHANATGHYAGHADPDPDLKWEGPEAYGVRKGLLTKFPRWNTHETWLRGAWPTNENGVAQFSSIFPGYYTGRATHVHIKVVPEWTTNENGTYNIGRLVHTGQLFFDDELNQIVDKMHPYTENPIRNKWGRARNWDDSLQIFQISHENAYHPIFDIQKLGAIIRQGLIGYATVGVDLKADYDRTSTQQGRSVKHAE